MPGNIKFENDWHASREDLRPPTPRMVAWTMRTFGFKSEHKANIALVIFSTLALLVSAYLFFF